LTINKLKRFSL